MHVIKRKTLQDFWRRHPAAETPLRAWLQDAQTARWRTMHDIKAYARTADAVGDNRVVFNIGGNKYRLVVLCLFAKGRLYIRFVGAHAEYDRIDAKKDMTMRPIRTEEDYRAAVARIDALVVRPDAERNEELALLSVLVQAYEFEQVPDAPMEPIVYLKASMDNRGLTQADLARLFGSSSRAAEVLGGKRELSKAMIRALAAEWGLDANTLIGARRAA